MNRDLEFLLSAASAGSLAPEHLADLERSTLTNETIRAQGIRSVPPAMIERLLGFDPRGVVSAYLIPFPDPRGGWMDHIRMKVFPPIATRRSTIKYLQPKRSGVRIYFPLATLEAALHAAAPLWIVEGEKKALAVAQLGFPTIGICGVEGWHLAGSPDLHPDFDDVGLHDRMVELLPDSDVHTNPAVRGAMQRLGMSLRGRGAQSRLVLLPTELPR